jgi:hypothetical protein
MTDECADLGGASSLMQVTDISWVLSSLLLKKRSPDPQLTAATVEIQWNQQPGWLPMCRKCMARRKLTAPLSILHKSSINNEPVAFPTC